MAIVVGVRPQFVKVRDFLRHAARIQHHDEIPIRFHIYDTRQHYSPELRLEVAQLGTSPWEERSPEKSEHILTDSIAWILDRIRASDISFSRVLVFGDANPALVGAVASSQCHIPLAHIEAGARRNPNEIEHRNGRMVDAVADVLGCVTRQHVANLAAEGHEGGVHLLGDISGQRILGEISSGKIAVEHSTRRRGSIVAIHRLANCTTETLTACIEAASSVATPVRVLAHPRLRELLPRSIPSHVTILPPQPHHAILSLVGVSRILISDSGGLIREAHYVRTPVVVLRSHGAWEELISAGYNRRSSASLPAIAAAAEALLRHVGTIEWETPYIYEDFDSRFAQFLTALAERRY